MCPLAVKILEQGIINAQDSAFPTLVKLDNGHIICGFSRGGGDLATGDSAWSISEDLGRTWSAAKSILGQTQCPKTANSLRLSKAADNTLIAYGQRNYLGGSVTFGETINEAVLCTSKDNGKSWSTPKILPKYQDVALEVSSPVAVLESGRWIAPCALLPATGKLAVKVIGSISDDRGESWRDAVIFHDEDEGRSFFEQKVIATGKDELMAVAWCAESSEYRDLENHFAWSEDGGNSWSESIPSGLMGQTMTPFLLNKDYALLPYNKRYGEQGIKLALAKISDRKNPEILFDSFIWKSNSSREIKATSNGVEEFADMKFGYPSIIHLDGAEYMLVFWRKASAGKCQIQKIIFSISGLDKFCG